jgi:beta-fructofuranosidase
MRRASPSPTARGPSSATTTVTTPCCEIEVPEGSGRVVVHFDTQERLEIELDAVANVLTIDRSQASLDLHAHDGRMQATDAFDPSSDRPAARILLDGPVVEVFTSAGRALRTRIYPTTHLPGGSKPQPTHDTGHSPPDNHPDASPSGPFCHRPWLRDVGREG